MTIYTFGKTFSDVETDFPDASPAPFGDDGAHGVTRNAVTAWLERGAGQLSSVVRSKLEIEDLLTLDASDTATLGGACVSYAVARALFKLRRFDEGKVFYDDYKSVLEQWEKRPSGTVSGGNSNGAYSTIPVPADPLRWGKGHKW